jgi:autophagy-related protein 9
MSYTSFDDTNNTQSIFSNIPLQQRNSIKNSSLKEPLLGQSRDRAFDYDLWEADDDTEGLLGDLNSYSNLFPSSSNNSYEEISEISKDGLDLFLTKLYRYYFHRGYWNIVTSQISEVLIFTFFVLFCLFIFGAVDYSTLFSFRDPSKTYQFGDAVHLEWLRTMNAYFIISLVIFSIYMVWKVIKIVYDAKMMWEIRNFYKCNLLIDDFELQTTRWTLVVKRLNHYLTMKGYDALESWNISARIMKKDNYLIAMIHHNILDYGIPILPESINNRVRRFLGMSGDERLKVNVFSRILLWSITYCIVNFIVNERNEVRNEIMFSDREHVQDSLINELRKKLRIIGILNLLLTPFLALFVPIYTLFHYGEEFYKNPSSASNREWGFSAKWKFREYNELPHIFKTRMYLSSKLAEQYIDQFPYTIYESISKLVAFVSSSLIVYFVFISIWNENALFNIEISPYKSVFWWVTVLSTVWVASRSVLKEQPIFFPEKKMEKLAKYLHYIPDNIISRPNSQESLEWIKKYYQFKIIQILREMISIIINPFILWFSLGKDENIERIIHFIRESTIEHSRLGKICEYSVFEIDDEIDRYSSSIHNANEVLISFNEVEGTTRGNTDTKMEQSKMYFKETSKDDIEIFTNSGVLIDELETNSGVRNDDNPTLLNIINMHKPSKI